MAPKGESDTGGLPDAVSDPAEALDPGGIDFTSLQLRDLSLNGPHPGDVQHAIDGDGAPVTTDPSTGLQTAQQDSAAFFNWLTLPPSTFWVNLSPNSLPNIIDPRLPLCLIPPMDRAGHRDGPRAQDTALHPQRAVEGQDGGGHSSPGNPAGSHLSAGCLGYNLPQWVPSVHPAAGHPGGQHRTVVRASAARVHEPRCRPVGGWARWPSHCHGPARGQRPAPELDCAPQLVTERGLGAIPLAVQRCANRVHLPVQEGGTTVNVTVYARGGVDLRQKIRETDTSNRQFKAHWPVLAAAAKNSSKLPATADASTLVGGGVTAGHASRSRRPHPMRVPRNVVAASGL